MKEERIRLTIKGAALCARWQRYEDAQAVHTFLINALAEAKIELEAARIDSDLATAELPG